MLAFALCSLAPLFPTHRKRPSRETLNFETRRQPYHNEARSPLPLSRDERLSLRMEIECPCCQHPVKLTGDEHTATLSDFFGRASVDCPNCGVVTLGGEQAETMQYSPTDESGHNTRVGHFVIRRLLGQGAFGAV